MTCVPIGGFVPVTKPTFSINEISFDEPEKSPESLQSTKHQIEPIVVAQTEDPASSDMPADTVIDGESQLNVFTQSDAKTSDYFAQSSSFDDPGKTARQIEKKFKKRKALALDDGSSLSYYKRARMGTQYSPMERSVSTGMPKIEQLAVTDRNIFQPSIESSTLRDQTMPNFLRPSVNMSIVEERTIVDGESNDIQAAGKSIRTVDDDVIISSMKKQAENFIKEGRDEATDRVPLDSATFLIEHKINEVRQNVVREESAANSQRSHVRVSFDTEIYNCNWSVRRFVQSIIREPDYGSEIVEVEAADTDIDNTMSAINNFGSVSNP